MSGDDRLETYCSIEVAAHLAGLSTGRVRRLIRSGVVRPPVVERGRPLFGDSELGVTRAELDQLPPYVPPIPASEARERVQQALDQHPATANAGIKVSERDGTLELRGRVSDAAARGTASEIARGVPGVGHVRNRL